MVYSVAVYPDAVYSVAVYSVAVYYVAVCQCVALHYDISHIFFTATSLCEEHI